ncbi:hypothetical protein IQ03_01017 [Gemmobacter caeni]|uniref:Uncharacterized protein n=1 Tax=Gemmobacter caeni TaxID=589035 RepID=A0A2T6B830_9RHOB|nr:hypothetical protein [Gemmobacter caeni]PTX52227.1 hypothetical protein C8N34_1025 [Gemmobacter caeni]TWJ02600.1 hypothetical protein IQ03_01017 [Gemmobacter caeni]
MTARTLQLTLRLLEEVVDPELLEELELPPTWVPGPVLDFLRRGVARMSADPEMRVTPVSPGTVPPGELSGVDILLCSPAAFEELLEQPAGVIGVHLVSTPDLDPFRDDSPHARAYRVAIPFDAEMVMDRIRDAVAGFDGEIDEADLVHGAMGWLVTLPHEVHHVLWFAGNGSFNSPADLDVMEGEIGHDLFDLSTGYGIRPALIDGAEVEPEDAEEAALLMEEMVEQRGWVMAERVFTGDLSPDRFLSLLGDALAQKSEFAKKCIEKDFPEP